MKRIWALRYEFDDSRINCFTWWQCSRWFMCFCALIWLDLICKKQLMYCFLPFGFINVIMFVINPSGFYSILVQDLEYPNLLCFDRGRWSELWYFNFESSLMLWWRCAGDFDGLQILVTLEMFRGFSRRFLSFEILKLRIFLGFTIFTLISNTNC